MSKVRKRDDQSQFWDYNLFNYILFGIGVLVIISGYILMANNDTNSFQASKLAPIILSIGYIIIIPCSILCNFSGKLLKEIK